MLLRSLEMYCARAGADKGKESENILRFYNFTFLINWKEDFECKNDMFHFQDCSFSLFNFLKTVKFSNLKI